MATDQPTAKPMKRGTLASVVGLITAGLLLTNIPKEESGRTVKVTIAQDGTATVRNVSGKQYLQAYLDIVGVATACDGLTSYHGRKVMVRDRFTEEQCGTMLEGELTTHAEGVMRCTPGLALTIPHRDHVRFAAVSLAYNIGVPRYCTSTMRRMINAGQIAAGCDALMSWNKAGRPLRVVSGLDGRRRRERAECAKDAA